MSKPAPRDEVRIGGSDPGGLARPYGAKLLHWFDGGADYAKRQPEPYSAVGGIESGQPTRGIESDQPFGGDTNNYEPAAQRPVCRRESSRCVGRLC